MDNNKYELVKTDFKISIMGTTLFRIKAKTKIEKYGINPGDLGGYVESENNLQVSGNAWVSGNARVYGNARVSGNAWVSGNSWVSGNARVYGDARVSGNARVSGDARVSGNARVYGDAIKTPLQIGGMKYQITIADNQVVWGCRKFTFDEVKALEHKDCKTSWDESEFKLNKKIITESIRYYSTTTEKK
jgi:cytoskeletal protein CcmA (bactofilin family)